MFIEIDNRDRDNGSSSNFSVDLKNIKNVFRGVGKIRFSSMTYTYSFYQITENNNKFVVEFGNLTSKTINLPVGNPSASVITASMTSQMNINTNSQTFTVTIDSTTGKLNITSAQNFSITAGSSADILGMVGTSATATSYTSVYPVNLTHIKYFYVHTNFKTKSGCYDSKSKNMNSVFVKIPCVGAFFSNQHYEINESEWRHINELPDVLDIRITDKDNNVIDFNNNHFNLAFEYINEFNNKNN